MAGVIEHVELRLRELLLDVAESTVTPITALPSADEGDPGTDSFALEALGRVFLAMLRAEDAPCDDLCPTSASGIARAIIRFVEEIFTEDRQDVADTLEQLKAAALRQARDVRPARTASRAAWHPRIRPSAPFAANPPRLRGGGLPLSTVANERNRTGRSENEVRVLTIDARAQRPTLPRHGPLALWDASPTDGCIGL